MDVEVEQVTRVHIPNKGFDWYYEIKECPDYPTEAYTISDYQEGKVVSEFEITKDAVVAIGEALISRGNK